MSQSLTIPIPSASFTYPTGATLPLGSGQVPIQPPLDESWEFGRGSIAFLLQVEENKPLKSTRVTESFTVYATEGEAQEVLEGHGGRHDAEGTGQTQTLATPYSITNIRREMAREGILIKVVEKVETEQGIFPLSGEVTLEINGPQGPVWRDTIPVTFDKLSGAQGKYVASAAVTALLDLVNTFKMESGEIYTLTIHLNLGENGESKVTLGKLEGGQPMVVLWYDKSQRVLGGPPWAT